MNSNQLHKPVLLNEVKKVLENFFDKDQRIYGVDGTFGRGGHSSEILSLYENSVILGIDRDQEALSFAKENYEDLIKDKRLSLLHANFSDQEKIEKHLKKAPDFILLDIGVSSPQLDNPERGFSFYHDGPLDMRMDQSQGEKASDVINKYSEEDLQEIFQEFGEVRAPKRLMEAILEQREIGEGFQTTGELSHLIERLCGWRKRGKHPATQYFQALRIYVNGELEHLKKAFDLYTDILGEGGILILITFHSLEDRMAKFYFRDSLKGKPFNKKVIKPTREEEVENKRARSAKLRVFIKENLNTQKNEEL